MSSSEAGRVSWENWFTINRSQETPPRTYCSTGLTRPQTTTLIGLVSDHIRAHEAPSPIPPILSLHEALTITLRYLRTNHTQHEIAETVGYSQPTVSRAVSALTGVVAQALEAFVPTADDVDLRATVLIDGTLLPCWSWAGRPDLWSGKHQTTGVNVRLACDLAGRILWVPDPLPGSTHDIAAPAASGLLEEQDPAHHIGDKGHQGSGMITSKKKPIGGELTASDKDLNRQLDSIRSAIERANAHIKNWKTRHTNHRRPFHTFETTITAVIGLYFLSRSEQASCASCSWSASWTDSA